MKGDVLAATVQAWREVLLRCTSDMLDEHLESLLMELNYDYRGLEKANEVKNIAVHRH